MPSEVEVRYDNERPWDPLGQGWIVPYVQFEREPIFYAGKWGQVVRITLNGEVPLGRITPAGLWNVPYPQRLIAFESVRDAIVTTFSKSLKEFYFKDTAGNEMRFPNTVVESIDFPNSGMHGTLPFSITLRCYEQDYFMAQGVMDVKDEFQTTENENGTLNVTHSISARGIDYTDASGLNHGLSNAIAWVNSRKGDTYKSEQGIYKAWHGGTKSGLNNPTVHLLLLDQQEKIDRLTGKYEVTETFIGYLDSINNAGIGGGIKKYGKKFTVDINESLNADFNIVTVSAEYRGGKETSLAELRAGFLNDNGGDPEGMMFSEAQRLSGFDGSKVDPLCNEALEPCIKKPTLFNVPYNYNLEENETDKVIKIKATFDTNPLFGDDKYYFDYKVSVKLDEIRKISKVSVEGELQARGLSTERQFHIKDFLDTHNVMDYLWQKADAQHALVMKECWQCSNGKYVRMGVEGNDAASANAACLSLYGSTLPANQTPVRCHELSKNATSLSVTKNEVKNQLTMSASFSDEDTLPLSATNCWQCWNNVNQIVGIVYADSAELAKEDCPDPLENVVTACDANSMKDFGPVSYTVDVTNPIEYVKAHPSAQSQYNGHWSIQKFGINTRAKSNVKVDLTFREDSGIVAKDVEPTLRAKSLEIQDTLNGMLSQNGSYDVSENISHKTSKSDSLSHSLERSYVPDENKVICVDLPNVESSKFCYMCLDENNAQVGSKVYAIDSGSAQELCNQKVETRRCFLCEALDFDAQDPNATGNVLSSFHYLDEQDASSGASLNHATLCHDVVSPTAGPDFVSSSSSPADISMCPGGTTSTTLTASSCDNCWSCLETDGTLRKEVFATSESGAQSLCPGGTVQRCNQAVDEDCYKCTDVVDGMYASEVYAVTQLAAQSKCDAAHGANTTTATECPEDPEGSVCYKCMCGDTPLGTLMALNESDATVFCSFNYSGYCEDPITAELCST